MKECTGCHQFKPTDAFSRSASAGDGLAYRCKDCCRVAYRAKVGPPKPPVVRGLEKRCPRCGQTKPRTDFAGGFCRACMKVYMHERHERVHPERVARREAREAKKRAKAERVETRAAELAEYVARKEAKKELKVSPPARRPGRPRGGTPPKNYDATVVEKRCKKCGVTKPVSEFGEHRHGDGTWATKDGLRSSCRTCRSLWDLNWAHANKELVNARQRATYKPKPSRVVWRALGFESREAWWASPDQVEKRRHKHRNGQSHRYRTDPVFWAQQTCRHMVKGAFRAMRSEKSIASAAFLGYSPADLLARLEPFYGKPCEEQRACDGTIITRENAHVDHIIPISTAQTLEEARNLSQLSNLRLICGPCNSDKSDKPAAYLTRVGHICPTLLSPTA